MIMINFNMSRRISITQCLALLPLALALAQSVESTRLNLKQKKGGRGPLRLRAAGAAALALGAGPAAGAMSVPGYGQVHGNQIHMNGLYASNAHMHPAARSIGPTIERLMRQAREQQPQRAVVASARAAPPRMALSGGGEGEGD